MASADAGSTATEIVIRVTKIVRIIAIAKLSNHKGIALTNQNRLMLLPSGHRTKVARAAQ